MYASKYGLNSIFIELCHGFLEFKFKYILTWLRDGQAKVHSHTRLYAAKKYVKIYLQLVPHPWKIEAHLHGMILSDLLF